MADLRDQFSDKEKDLSHLTPSAKPRPDAPRQDPKLPSRQVSPGRTNYVQPQSELPPPNEASQDENAEEAPSQLAGSNPNLQPSASRRPQRLTSERGRGRGHEAAEHHLGKKSAAGSLKKQIARRGIMAGCAAVAAEGVVVGIVAIMLFAAALSFTGDTAQAGTCETGDGISVGTPNEQGIVQLPDNALYAISNPDQRNEQWGKPELVQSIIEVAERWNEKHPNSKLSIGDLGFGEGAPYAAYKAYNPPQLHQSHRTGLDVDLTHAQATVVGNSALSSELGKLFIDVGNVELILFNDAATQNEVNRYRSEKGLPGRMLSEPGHDTHFHVRIKAGPIEGSASSQDCESTSSGVKYNKQYTERELRRIFGPPSREVPSNLASVNFLGTSVQIHKLVAPSLKAVSDEIEASGITYRPEPKKEGVGCFRPRDDGQLGDRSYHVYGAACDINPLTNPYINRNLPYNPSCGIDGILYNTCYDMPPEYVRIFAKHGFTWGGKWRSVKDYMHFEWHGVKP